MRKLVLPLLFAAALPLAGSSAAAPASAASAPAAKSAIPTAGAMAPDFSLPDETGTVRTRAAQRGRPLLIAFYPRDFTGG